MSTAPFARVAQLRDPGLEAVLWSLVPALVCPRACASPLGSGRTLQRASSVDAQPVRSAGSRDGVAAGAGALARMAGRLDGVGPSPALQLDVLAERVAGSFRVLGDARCELDDVRPDRVATSARGDALVAAALTVAVGQRRGWDVAVVLGERAVLVGHRGLDAPLVCSVRHEGRLLDAGDLEDPQLRWCTAHDVAAALLDRVAAVAAEGARPDLVLQARELGRALPETVLDRARTSVQLARAWAAFN